MSCGVRTFLPRHTTADDHLSKRNCKSRTRLGQSGGTLSSEMGLVVWAQLEDEQSVRDATQVLDMPLLAVGNPGATRGALATRLEAPPLDDLRAVPEGASTLLIMTDEEVTSESLRPWASGTQQVFTTGSFPAEPEEAAALPDRVRLAPRFLRSAGFRSALDLLEASPTPSSLHADFSGKTSRDLRALLIDALDTLHHVGGAVVSLRAKQDTPGGARISVLLKHETERPSRPFEATGTHLSSAGSWWWALRSISWKSTPKDSGRTVTKAWMKAGTTIVRVQYWLSGRDHHQPIPTRRRRGPRACRFGVAFAAVGWHRSFPTNR